jgi:hypothetical protein
MTIASHHDLLLFLARLENGASRAMRRMVEAFAAAGEQNTDDNG